MTKNKMTDLNDHLFMALERLNEDDATAEDIEREAKRAEAIVNLADQIVSGHRLSLDAARLYAQHGAGVLPMLPQIGGTAPKVIEEKGE